MQMIISNNSTQVRRVKIIKWFVFSAVSHAFFTQYYIATNLTSKEQFACLPTMNKNNWTTEFSLQWNITLRMNLFILIFLISATAGVNGKILSRRTCICLPWQMGESSVEQLYYFLSNFVRKIYRYYQISAL